MDKKRFIIISIIIILFMIAITISHFYYNDKLEVSFETGTEEKILTKYVSKNSKVTEPFTPSKEGYVFVEWQLNGEKYNFDEKVQKNIVLSAKWAKEEYIIINFDTDSEDIIDSKKILKGNIINDLPIPNKEGYEFLGWYLNEQKYNNEELNSDITLVAKYEEIIIKPIFNIKDKVLIIGEYSDNAYSSYAYNEMAIGWEREILYIVEDSNYPYAVGDSRGVTGYFQASSLEIKK